METILGIFIVFLGIILLYEAVQYKRVEKIKTWSKTWFYVMLMLLGAMSTVTIGLDMYQDVPKNDVAVSELWIGVDGIGNVIPKKVESIAGDSVTYIHNGGEFTEHFETFKANSTKWHKFVNVTVGKTE